MNHLYYSTKSLLLLVIISIGLSCTLLQAQVAKFGKVDEEEFKTIVYDLDTSAAAIVLFETGKTTFQYTEGKGIIYNMEVHRRIKILKKTGYDEANVLLSYYSPSANTSREKILDLKGYTYRLENGNVEKYKLEKNSIFEEKVNENMSVLNLQYLK